MAYADWQRMSFCLSLSVMNVFSSRWRALNQRLLCAKHMSPAASFPRTEMCNSVLMNLRY